MSEKTKRIIVWVGMFVPGLVLIGGLVLIVGLAQIAGH